MNVSFSQSKAASDISDEELVMRYTLHQDHWAMGVLYERYAVLVFGVCRKYLRDTDEARELCMQIFEQLLTDIGRHQIEKFRPWLHTLVRNKCLMELRKKKFTQDVDDENFLETRIMESEPRMHHTLEGELRLARLEALIDELPDEQANCIRLFYLQEKSYAEVAAITGYTAGNVKSYIQNGKRNLKNLMTASGEFELLMYLLLSCTHWV